MELQIETRRFGIKTVLLDDADYDLIKSYVWHIQYDKGNFYARCNIRVNGKPKSPKMHRMIMGVSNSDKPHVDHINENGLDNRRSNLRTATIPENSRNTGPNSRSVTGYKGVSLYKVGPQAGKYVARLRFESKTYLGGYFDTAIEAAVSYNEMAKKYHGEFAWLNKIDETELAKAKLYVPPKKEPKPPKGKSGFYGVQKDNSSFRNRPFRCLAFGKYIGNYLTAEDAAKAYDEKAKELYGVDAVLNFKE